MALWYGRYHYCLLDLYSFSNKFCYKPPPHVVKQSSVRSFISGKSALDLLYIASARISERICTTILSEIAWSSRYSRGTLTTHSPRSKTSAISPRPAFLEPGKSRKPHTQRTLGSLLWLGELYLSKWDIYYWSWYYITRTHSPKRTLFGVCIVRRPPFTAFHESHLGVAYTIDPVYAPEVRDYLGNWSPLITKEILPFLCRLPRKGWVHNRVCHCVWHWKRTREGFYWKRKKNILTHKRLC